MHSITKKNFFSVYRNFTAKVLEDVINQYKCPIKSIAGNFLTKYWDWKSRPVVYSAINELNVQPNDKILEIGFGRGSGLKKVFDIIEKGDGCAYGYELSQYMVDCAEKTYILEISESSKMIIDFAPMFNFMPYLTNFFDGIYHVDVFYFWKNSVMYNNLMELNRILKPGKKIICAMEINRLKKFEKYGILNTAQTDPVRFLKFMEWSGFNDVHIEYRTIDMNGDAVTSKDKNLREIQLLIGRKPRKDEKCDNIFAESSKANKDADLWFNKIKKEAEKMEEDNFFYGNEIKKRNIFNFSNQSKILYNNNVLGNLKNKRNYSNKFITLPIFYVNGDPHIGHLYTMLLGDATYRWELLKKNSENLQIQEDFKKRHIFSGGTDEHGLKIELAAKLNQKMPEIFCEYNYRKFKKLFLQFNISLTDFIRTTEQKHTLAVQKFWETLNQNGCIFKEKYSGWYSSIDECFYKEFDTQLTEENGYKRIAKETGSIVEFAEEENYMFCLKNYIDNVKEWLLNSNVVYPKVFLSNLLPHLNNKFNISISRNAARCQWGISVPNDKNQTIYVWLDALINYLTVAGYPQTDSDNFMWPPDLQIIGKDILKFHAIYWPAFLMAANLPLPKKIFVHGHWLVDKVKMSKSLGNVIDPFQITKKLTIDGLRYFLLKQGIPHDDNKNSNLDFTLLKAISVINSDLINNLGNLIQRATAKSLNPHQLYPKFDAEIMERELKKNGNILIKELQTLLERVSYNYNDFMFYRALEIIAETIKHTNAFFQFYEPWKMSQGPVLSAILFLVYEACRISCILLQPIVPSYSEKALIRLGIKSNECHLHNAVFNDKSILQTNNRLLGTTTETILKRIILDNNC